MIGPTFAGHSARILAAYTQFDHLEGDGPVEGVVLAEFPSKAAAKAWYESPEYREVRRHRVRGAKYLGILVEGGWKAIDERMPHTKGRSLAAGDQRFWDAVGRIQKANVPHGAAQSIGGEGVAQRVLIPESAEQSLQKDEPSHLLLMRRRIGVRRIGAEIMADQENLLEAQVPHQLVHVLGEGFLVISLGWFFRVAGAP